MTQPDGADSGQHGGHAAGAGGATHPAAGAGGHTQWQQVPRVPGASEDPGGPGGPGSPGGPGGPGGPDEPRASGTPGAGTAGAPWTMVDAIGIVVVTAVTTIAFVFGIALLTALRLTPEALIPVLLPLPLVLLGVVTVIWIQIRYGGARRLMGPVRAGARDWLLGIGIGVGAFLAVNIGLSLLLQGLGAVFGFELPAPQEDARAAAADPELLPWLLLATVIAAPIAEELFFRGLLQQSLRRRMRAWSAIAISAVVFAGAHVFQEIGGAAGPVAFGLILPLGVLLGWLFERRGNLAMPIALHATFNLITIGLFAVGQTMAP